MVIPGWLITLIVTCGVTILGALLLLAWRYGRLTKTVEEVSRKCDGIEARDNEQGRMSVESHERFARIEQQVESSVDEILRLREAVHQHNNRMDIHVTQEWRDELFKRFDRMEQRIEQLLQLALGPRK
jgi:HAMP domain-containing protein